VLYIRQKSAGKHPNLKKNTSIAKVQNCFWGVFPQVSSVWLRRQIGRFKIWNTRKQTKMLVLKVQLEGGQ